LPDGIPIFNPKIPTWANLGGSTNGKMLVYFVCFSPFWYVLPRKIWQPWASLDAILCQAIVKFESSYFFETMATTKTRGEGKILEFF
jgi:hypothetical protein